MNLVYTLSLKNLVFNKGDKACIYIYKCSKWYESKLSKM